MPSSSKLKDVGFKPHHTLCDCPFCDKQAIRKDYFPSHLKTEMKKRGVETAEEMLVKLQEAEDNQWIAVDHCNVLVKEEIKSGGDRRYSAAVCFDCHRLVNNSDPTCTKQLMEHDCQYRKRKPDVIEHVTEAVVTTPEAPKTDRFLTLRDVIKHNLTRHRKMDKKDKDVLLAMFKGCRQTDKADEIDEMFCVMTNYFVGQISDLRESGDASDFEKQFTQDCTIASLFDDETPVPRQIKGYLRAWKKYAEEAGDITDQIKKAVRESAAGMETEIMELTMRNSALQQDSHRLGLALGSANAENNDLRKELELLRAKVKVAPVSAVLQTSGFGVSVTTPNPWATK